MRVLLIEPNAIGDFPRKVLFGQLESPWAGYLAASIIKKHKVKFLNANLTTPDDDNVIRDFSRLLSYADINKVIKKFKPDVIGFSLYELKSSINFTEEVIKNAKKINPNCKIAIGGHYATFEYEKLLRGSIYDFILRGQADLSFPKLIDALETGGNLHKIQGLAFKQNGNIINTGLGERIKNLDELPFPAREVYPVVLDKNIPIQRAITSGRGCPWGKCAFCSIGAFYGGHYYASRSAENIMDEIEEILKTKNVSIIVFYDEGILTKMDKLIAEKRKRNINFKFMINARGDMVNRFKENVKLAAENGLQCILIGTENFSDRILRSKYNKGISAAEMISALEFLNTFSFDKFPNHIPFSPWITKTELIYNLVMLYKYNFYKQQFFICASSYFNEMNPYVGTMSAQGGYTPDSYMDEQIQKTLCTLMSVKGTKKIDNLSLGNQFKLMHKREVLNLLKIIILSLRGDEDGTEKSKKELENFLMDNTIARHGNSEHLICLEKTDTPALIFKEMHNIKKISGQEFELIKKLKDKNIILVPPLDKDVILNIQNEKTALVSNNQNKIIQYMIIGLNNSEVLEQMKYETIKTTKKEIEECRDKLKSLGFNYG